MPAMVNRKESKTSVAVMLKKACAAGIAIPAFNIPYLPMIEPIIQAVVDQNAFALVEVARLEWMKFESQSMSAVMQEFLKWNQPDYVRIHLDHIPVIDEDGQQVDFVSIINEAIGLGYHSVMIDGSRLNLLENIATTKKVVDLAHQVGIACEAELGAVLGHEAGPLPPYEELFKSGMGFTAVEEACKFVQETQCDWLSVAIGNIHGNISKTQRDQKKVQARLNLEHLKALRQHTGIPLVLHGGSSVKQEDLFGAMKNGIAKINIATEIRQPFEQVLSATDSIPDAQAAVFQRTTWVIRDYLKLQNSRDLLMEMD